MNAFPPANIKGVKETRKPSPRSEGRRLWKTARAQRFRAWVLARDMGTCRICGRSATEVHHIDPIEAGGAVLSAGDAIAICHPCHLAQHA